MPQQISPLVQSESASHEFNAAAGVVHSFGYDRSTGAQISPRVPSHFESSAQKRGHAVAAVQMLPESPRSQQSSPWLVSQSPSLPQDFAQVAAQMPSLLLVPELPPEPPLPLEPPVPLVPPVLPVVPPSAPPEPPVSLVPPVSPVLPPVSPVLPPLPELEPPVLVEPPVSFWPPWPESSSPLLVEQPRAAKTTLKQTDARTSFE